MTDSLISTHELRVIERPEKPTGWTVYEYRGATLRSSGVHNMLQMPGHPLDKISVGHVRHLQRVVDEWLEHQRLPPPYVWPARDR